MTATKLRQGAAAHPPTRRPPGAGTAATGRTPQRLLDDWLTTQAVNVLRHARSVRRFAPGEFGSGVAAPSEAHVEAVNRFLEGLRLRVEEAARGVEAAVRDARRDPRPERLRLVLERKHRVSLQVQYVEGIWDFYFSLFTQRLSSFGERLRAVDRIAANCYEDVYLALGTARPVPRLLPFTVADGSPLGPRTYRRAVPLARLRNHPNLFPLVFLPRHRLDAVHAMSSVLHEVAHNLQADLRMWDVLPSRIHRRLTGAGLPADVSDVWAAWHKEMTADLFALLLGGPAAAESLMDVVGRSRAATVAYTPGGVHPTPYLRVLITCELLRRLRMPRRAQAVAQVWGRLYPGVGEGDIPALLLRTFPAAVRLTVDTVAFRPHPELAGRSMAQLLPFGAAQSAMVRSAGERLARGEDPGTVPLRFMIGAARHALEHRLASPQAITDNFYAILGRR